MQSKDNLERLRVILAFIATRLLQLRFMNESDELSKSSCEPILKGKAWKLMWLKLERKGLPKEAPDISWAYRGIARLGLGEYKANGSSFYKDIMARMV